MNIIFLFINILDKYLKNLVIFLEHSVCKNKTFKSFHFAAVSHTLH